ncbi:cadherin repeat domain-containing protein [Flagellimonas sp. CMM7]|uniref:cadherin repeat domain-containing protein n=1 Tax=Flagellimonas sp. CMM7 TaxID=2654676 RepID=UPI0013D81A39|nr:cadherin repeat domain-containing protein [Flagellimonas sp. CMM7]UII79622.1 cadherin repeat domain-containing protein [Flagellimonas sp. CMM7]
MRINFFYVFLFLSVMLSCTEKDDESMEVKDSAITISVEDLIISINENPSNDFVLGKVKAKTNKGNLTYSIEEQNPSEALSIIDSTGELVVKNNSLFDFEVNPKITAKVKVSNLDVFELVTVTITLNNIENTSYISMINENHIWVSSTYDNNDGFDTFIEHKIYFNGIDLVNNETYFNLYYKQINYSYGSPWFIINNSSVEDEGQLLYKIREDTEREKVYTLDSNNNEVLLYDFSLEVNEAVDLWDHKTGSYITRTLESKGQVKLLNGETRKRMFFNDNYIVIEGIGALYNSNSNTALYYLFNGDLPLYDGKNYQYVDLNDYWQEGGLPVISLKEVSQVGDEIIFRSNLSSDGGNYIENNILEKGVCWSSTSNTPTIDDSHTMVFSNENDDGSNRVNYLGTFYASINYSELQPTTTYYFRAYSKNNNGVAYSNTIYTFDTTFLSITLNTELINQEEEIENGRRIIKYTVGGKVVSNNLPSSISIIEKGIAVFNRFRFSNDPNPSESEYYSIEAGTLDNFQYIHYIAPDAYDPLTDPFLYSVFWSYVKLSNGQIVYGNPV